MEIWKNQASQSQSARPLRIGWTTQAQTERTTAEASHPSSGEYKRGNNLKGGKEENVWLTLTAREGDVRAGSPPAGSNKARSLSRSLCARSLAATETTEAISSTTNQLVQLDRTAGVISSNSWCASVTWGPSLGLRLQRTWGHQSQREHGECYLGTYRGRCPQSAPRRPASRP
jgi:hypothetical protein